MWLDSFFPFLFWLFFLSFHFHIVFMLFLLLWKKREKEEQRELLTIEVLFTVCAFLWVSEDYDQKKKMETGKMLLYTSWQFVYSHFQAYCYEHFETFFLSLFVLLSLTLLQLFAFSYVKIVMPVNSPAADNNNNNTIQQKTKKILTQGNLCERCI